MSFEPDLPTFENFIPTAEDALDIIRAHFHVDPSDDLKCARLSGCQDPRNKGIIRLVMEQFALVEMGALSPSTATCEELVRNMCMAGHTLCVARCQIKDLINNGVSPEVVKSLAVPAEKALLFPLGSQAVLPSEVDDVRILNQHDASILASICRLSRCIRMDFDGSETSPIRPPWCRTAPPFTNIATGNVKVMTRVVEALRVQMVSALRERL